MNGIQHECNSVGLGLIKKAPHGDQSLVTLKYLNNQASARAFTSVTFFIYTRLKPIMTNWTSKTYYNALN